MNNVLQNKREEISMEYMWPKRLIFVVVVVVASVDQPSAGGSKTGLWKTELGHAGGRSTL